MAHEQFLDNLVNNRKKELKKDLEINGLYEKIRKDNIVKLYLERYRTRKGLFRLIVWELEKDKKFSLEPLKDEEDINVYRNEFSKENSKTSEYLETIGKIIKCLTKGTISNLYKKQNPLGNIKSFEPGREIFFWAVLTGMDKETKLMIWKNLVKDHVVCAVIASTMMKSMAELLSKRSFTLPTEDPYFNTTTQEDIEECENKSKIFRIAAELLSDAKEYDTLADGVLQICNNKHSNHLSYLLVRELPDWSSKSLFLMKYKGQLQLAETDKQFLNLARDRMKETWYKNIDTDTPLWLIWLCIFLPFIFVHFIKFNYSYKLNDRRKESTFENMLEKYFKDKNPESFFHKCFQFYFAPVVKFSMHTMSYLAYLILFSIFLITDFNIVRLEFMKYWSGRGHPVSNFLGPQMGPKM